MKSPVICDALHALPAMSQHQTTPGELDIAHCYTRAIAIVRIIRRTVSVQDRHPAAGKFVRYKPTQGAYDPVAIPSVLVGCPIEGR